MMSVQDPEMLHGLKSSSRRIDGLIGGDRGRHWDGPADHRRAGYVALQTLRTSWGRLNWWRRAKLTLA